MAVVAAAETEHLSSFLEVSGIGLQVPVSFVVAVEVGHRILVVAFHEEVVASLAATWDGTPMLGNDVH